MWRLWRRENQKRPCKLIAFVGHTVTEIDFTCLDSFFPFLVSRRLIATGSLNFCVRRVHAPDCYIDVWCHLVVRLDCWAPARAWQPWYSALPEEGRDREAFVEFWESR